MPRSRTDTLGEAAKVARQFVESAEYQAELLARSLAGDLPPQIEVMLWHYAFGKPVEQIEVNNTYSELKDKSLDEIADEAQQLATRLAAATEQRRKLVLVASNPDVPSARMNEQGKQEPQGAHFADVAKNKAS